MKNAILLLLLMLVPFGTNAQEEDGCGDTELLPACFVRIYEKHFGTSERVEAQVEANLQADVRRRPTGFDAAGSDVSSAKKDFLNHLFFAVQSATLDAKKQELVITWNLPKLDSSTRPVFQLQSVVRQPQLFSSLKSALNGANQTAQVAELERDLDDLDDVSAVLVISYEGKRLGRSFAPHRDDFAAQFQAIRALNSEMAADATRARDESNQMLQRQFPDATDTDTLTLSSITDPQGRDRFERAYVASARAQGEADRQLAQLVAENRLEGFKDLVDNQPQFFLTVSWRDRDELVGPDLLTAQLSYEWNLHSLNSFRAFRSSRGGDASIADYLEENPAKRNGRWKFSAEYTESEEYSARPDLSFPTGLDSATRLAGSLTFGKPLLFDGKGDERARLDFLAQYEDFSDDPMHQDRGVASLTYTQKISDTLSLPIGLSYANHGEFLGEVDQRFGAHFGLSLRVFNP